MSNNTLTSNDLGEKKNTNNKLNYISLSSFLKKADKPLEFKVLSQNSSRSEIKLSTDLSKINFENDNDKEKFISSTNNNHQEIKDNSGSTSKEISEKNDKQKRNMNVFSQKEIDETINDNNLFTFHKNELNEYFADLNINEISHFKQNLLKFKKNSHNSNKDNYADIFKELTSIRDLINEILK